MMEMVDKKDDLDWKIVPGGKSKGDAQCPSD